MNRILFVESDPATVAALRASMGRLPRWNAAFATSAQQALHALSQARFDVVVCARALAPLDGLELLARVRLHAPAVIRVLSADAMDGDTFERALDVAQRVLAHPPGGDDLEQMLDGLAAATARGRNPLVRTLVGRIGVLPSPRSIVARLNELMLSPDGASITQIAALIGTDPALSMKVMQLVNSAWCGVREPVTALPHAISLLGLTPLRALIMMSQVLSAGRGVDGPHFSVAQVQDHALRVARLARAVAGADDRDAAFTAGLLHDIGRLVLAQAMPSRYPLALRHAAGSARSLTDVETCFIGVAHDEIGAGLAEIWGLPDAIVQAIERHHDLHRGIGRHAGVVEAVQKAHRLVVALERDGAPDADVALDERQRVRVDDEIDAMGLRAPARAAHEVAVRTPA